MRFLTRLRYICTIHLYQVCFTLKRIDLMQIVAYIGGSLFLAFAAVTLVEIVNS